MFSGAPNWNQTKRLISCMELLVEPKKRLAIKLKLKNSKKKPVLMDKQKKKKKKNIKFLLQFSNYF